MKQSLSFVSSTLCDLLSNLVSPQSCIHHVHGFLWSSFRGIVPLRNLAIHSDPMALLFGLGGYLASTFKPVVDFLGFCFFSREGNRVAFEFLGRPIPVFVPATYGWFVGDMGYWFYNVFRDSKTTAKDVWSSWFKAFATNLVLKYPPLYYGIYIYYGYQFLVVGGFPLWLLAVIAISPMVAGTVPNIKLLTLRGE